MRALALSAGVLALASLASTGLAQTIRTVASSAGAGVWASPYATVQAALAVSVSGDEVWVKTGTYTAPTAGYSIPSGVILRGGFAGTEQVIADRGTNPAAFVTTLSGNLKTTIVMNGAGAGTLIDRLTLINGRASNADGHGGAIRMTNSTATIRDCVFDSNASYINSFSSTWTAWNGGDGGAVWMTGSNAVVERCTFTNNSAAAGNGGSCASGTTAAAQRGGSGGAVAMVNSSASFAACAFSNNATGNGGTGPGCVVQTGTGGPAGAGGAVYGTGSSATFTDCTFTGNHAGSGGAGGTRNGVGSPGGEGGAGGAAAFSGVGTLSFDHCTFLTNLAGAGGTPGFGAASTSSTPTKEGGSGGAVWTSGLTSISVSRCVFDGNTGGNGSNASDAMSASPSTGGAGGSGGAMALVNTPGSLANCLLVRNAPGNGGLGSVTPPGKGGPAGSAALQVGGSPSLLTLTNITANLNNPGVPGSTPSVGAASFSTEIWAPGASGGSVLLRNSILWEGASPAIPAISGTVDSAYSLVVGAAGPGVIFGAPTFVNAGSDWNLAAGSRGIDAGDNTAAGVAGPDLAGNLRFREDTGVANTGVAGGAGGASIVDMGAYEFQGTTPHCPADFDNSGNLAIADIFAFLNAWFAGDPAADFNGGGLAVQDIFDFLNAWFSGC